MRLVADANVLLSTVLGGRASIALTHPGVEEVFTAAALAEVQEYVAVLARKKRLPLALHLRAAVWSNDDDPRDTGVEWFTTATLLKRLGVS